jgi:hypothetical protein
MKFHMKRFTSTVAVSIVFLLPAAALAWGPEGHEVVAALAQSLLSDTAKSGIQSLIGNSTLSSISNWADQVRSQRDETYNWHFVDIPKSAEDFSEDRDCFLPTNSHAGAATDHHDCVVDRITLFKQILGDTTKSPQDREEALKFIVHFVGDVHQPFHAIGDKAGGNGVHITEFGSTQCNGNRACNLHGAWDSGMIEHSGLSRDVYVEYLKQFIATSHLVASGNPEDWANESHAAGQVAWLDNGGVIDDAYYNIQIQVVNKRLALAGLRLAALLEDVFGNQAPQPVSTPASGQTAVATRNVNLRSDPSTTHPPLETLHQGAKMTVLDIVPVNRFYRVQAADGKRGWAYGRYVQVKPN